MFHINNNNEAKPCRAKAPENCRFYKDEDDTRHYESVAEAQKFIESKLEAEHGETRKEVRYSFVKAFKKQEEQFEKDFDGIPKRFFNADLRGKLIREEADEASMNVGADRRININNLAVRLTTALSETSDNKMSNEEVETLLSEQGYTDVQEIKGPLLKNFKTERAWKATLEDQDVIILDGNAGTKIGRYAFRTTNDYFEPYKYWTKLDLRKVSGNARAEKKTGVNILKTVMQTKSVKEVDTLFKDNVKKAKEALENDTTLPETEKQLFLDNLFRSDYKRGQIVQALLKLEDAQFEGKNFISQKKYIKEHSGSVATAYEDKKNPDKIRQDMMKNTRLNKYFRKVEIDNDVDPAEFAQFEKDYEDVMSKLPKIPKGREPELRIRKLGKHKANGIYFPHKNTVSIDVRTSGSFVHEMAHQYDFAIKENASLRDDFREIANDYSKSLKVPATEPSSRAEYLTTPTEILARGFESYAHQKLGINNKLIDISKFDNYDHEPFKNPKLKEKMFAFFDKLYDEDKDNN